RYSSNIAVWDFNDGYFWKLFNPKICLELESAYQMFNLKKSTNNPITVEKSTVDFKLMQRTSNGSNQPQKIRRIVFGKDSVLANRYTWKWKEKKAHLISYPSEIAQLIEELSKDKLQKSLDLSAYVPSMPYTVNLNSKSKGFQYNNSTGYRREVKRERLTSSFPTTNDQVSQRISLGVSFISVWLPLNLSNSSMGTQASNQAHKHSLPNSSKHLSYNPVPSSSKRTSHNPTTNPITHSSNNPFPSSSHHSSHTTVPSSSHHPSYYPLPNPITPTPYNPVPSSSNHPSYNSAPGSTNFSPAILKKYSTSIPTPPNEDCVVCLSPLSGASGFQTSGNMLSGQPSVVIELTTCKHIFHSECLLASMTSGNSFTCPCCKEIYGIKTGNQPPGMMTSTVIRASLPGECYTCDTIQITYDIRSGIQTQDHPNPGSRYSCHGFPRIAYLPNDKEGKKVLKLLQIAWDRKLIFTVGDSVTSGAKDTVTWNEIHHKTSMRNYHGHGYPDPSYIDNVLSELKAQGVS
uniref:E3 ubiquitin-protein ligase n=1 Tax=Ciona savignyi TaxID=51511 RepID=H2YYG5_CIOSA